MTITQQNQAQTCKELVKTFSKKEQNYHTEKIEFDGVGNNDVYNISAPFLDNGEEVIAGRVEARDSECSKIVFFVQKGNVWVPREDAPIFELQDPFFTKVNNELIFGGVQTYPHPINEGMLGWRTVLYKGKCICSLAEFFIGPDGMKDLRLVELHDKRIGVLTRPQGEKGGRGKIGWAIVNSLSEITVELINNIPLLNPQFSEGEWGGANEAHLLKNGLIGVLGHVACFDENNDRHYYPMVFGLNPETGVFSKMELIATRSCFLPGPSKFPDIVDVVFGGGLVRNDDGTAVLYAGTSDVEAQKLTIEDPFLQFEK